jgi:hypothetical protein
VASNACMKALDPADFAPALGDLIAEGPHKRT